MAILLDQADQPFGTLTEMTAWLESHTQSGFQVEGTHPPAALPPSQTIPLLPFDNGSSWVDTDNTFNGAGLFDFDLFSWDPDFLAPDWMPAPSVGTGGHTTGSGIHQFNGHPASGAYNHGPEHINTPEQEGWRNALR